MPLVLSKLTTSDNIILFMLDMYVLSGRHRLVWLHLCYMKQVILFFKIVQVFIKIIVEYELFMTYLCAGFAMKKS